MDDLDRILFSESPVRPSPGFARSVMQAVRREAETPPLAFPWRRLVAGLGLAGLILLGALFVIPPQAEPAITTSMLQEQLLTVLTGPIGQLMMALVASLLSIRLSFRLAGDRT
jgi:hypothetical protein